MEGQLRRLARATVPFAVRVEIARLRRLPGMLLERGRMVKAGASEPLAFSLAERASPLCRPYESSGAPLRAKIRNVGRVVEALGGVTIAPYQTFSYHHLVGRPSRRRGFARGLELHDARPSRGVGGGACQVSNLVYQLALWGGMRIVERHRHGLDLFPDAGRTVPFGCGATVFYNYADLRFENPLPRAVRLNLSIEHGFLVGGLSCATDPGYRVEVYESQHAYWREGPHWIRENRIRRRLKTPSGAVLSDHQVAHNLAHCLYEPMRSRALGEGTPIEIEGQAA